MVDWVIVGAVLYFSVSVIHAFKCWLERRPLPWWSSIGLFGVGILGAAICFRESLR